MSCLGVHFALSNEDVAALLERAGDAERLEFLQEALEPRYFEEQTYIAESDKAWDAMHRALADGLLSYDGGAYPLSHVVLGGKQLYFKDDYIMSLKSPEKVRDAALAVAEISESDLRERYERIDPSLYGLELTTEDFDYTREWFQGVRKLLKLAASQGRHVLFTADQ